MSSAPAAPGSIARFAGRVLLVTGGSAGMGLATAHRLATEGARVVVTGRRAAALDVAVKSSPVPDAIVPMVADTASVDDATRVAAAVRERFGVLDGLFVNAGLGLFKPFVEFTPEDFDFLVGVNFRGAFFTTQRLLPLLRDGGAIVVNASWTLHRGLANATLYSATKGALHSLVRGLAVELSPRAIRVNSVSPGYVNTEQFNESALPPEMATELRRQVPSGRFGTPDEVAAVVAFLLSDEARYVNGQDWIVDAALTAVHRPLAG